MKFSELLKYMILFKIQEVYQVLSKIVEINI